MTQQRFTFKAKAVARKARIVPQSFSKNEKYHKAGHVYAICEEGGDLLFCDGPCMRHFHENRVNKMTQLYACKRIRGTILTGGRWKCSDCILWQAKCSRCHLTSLFEEVGKEPPLLRTWALTPCKVRQPPCERRPKFFNF